MYLIMTSLYNIMTSYTIEQLENQLSERQPSSLLIITKNFSLFVTNFKKACRSLHTLFVHRLIYSKIISTFPSQSTSMPPRYITGKKIPGHPRRLLRFSVLLLWSAAENHQNIPFQRLLPDLPSASLHGSI